MKESFFEKKKEKKRKKEIDITTTFINKLKNGMCYISTTKKIYIIHDIKFMWDMFYYYPFTSVDLNLSSF